MNIEWDPEDEPESIPMPRWVMIMLGVVCALGAIWLAGVWFLIVGLGFIVWFFV